MKKITAIAAVLSALCLSTACGTKIENTEPQKQTESVTSETETVETTTEPESDTKESTAVTTTTTTTVTSTTEVSTTTTVTTTTTTKTDDNTSLDNSNVSQASKYEYDLSDDDLISKAQSMFDEAVSVYNRFIYDGAYQVDDSEMYTSDSGESMLKITDPSVSSVSDVVDDFEQYFSEKYEDPVPMVYVESGGNVYYIQSDRGSDASYISTTITGIMKKTDDEVFFTAESFYDDGSVQNNTYSIVYGENGVEWKTGMFKLPN